MHKVNRRLRQLGQPNAAVGGFALHDGRARHRVVARRGVAGLQRLLDQQVDHSAVFGMQRHHAALGPHLAQHAEDGGVIGHHHAGVGHEHLEAGHALMPHGVPHVFEHLVIDPGHDHVQAVVHRHLGVGAGLGPGDGAQGRVGLGLQGKVDHRGGAAKGGGPGAAGKGVAGDGGADHVFQVHMGVHPARQHIQAAGIDNRHVGPDLNLMTDGVDDAVFEQHISHIVIGGGDNPAIADQDGVRRCAHGGFRLKGKNI